MSESINNMPWDVLDQVMVFGANTAQLSEDVIRDRFKTE